VKLRSLCLHLSLNPLTVEALGNAEEVVKRFVAVARPLLAKWGCKDATLRLALPPLNGEKVESVVELAKAMQELAVKCGVEYVGGLHLRASLIPSVERGLREAIVENDRVFASAALTKDEEAEAVARFTLSLSNYLETGASVRFACTMLSHVETPYLPAAASLSGRNGVSANLLYVDLVKKARSLQGLVKSLKGASKEAWSVVLKAAREVGVEALGVDLSLSPWLEESVADAYESLTGTPITSPGALTRLKALSSCINRVKRSVKSVGFNDLMLPYAEDRGLMELGAQGKLTLWRLLVYSLACVAGLDMIPVPSRVGVKWVKGVIADAFTIARIKGKPLGVRLLPANAEVGDVIDAWFFKGVPIPRLDENQ